MGKDRAADRKSDPRVVNKESWWQQVTVGPRKVLVRIDLGGAETVLLKNGPVKWTGKVQMFKGSKIKIRKGEHGQKDKSGSITLIGRKVVLKENMQNRDGHRAKVGEPGRITWERQDTFDVEVRGYRFDFVPKTWVLIID